jgi:hypothetical protein
MKFNMVSNQMLDSEKKKLYERITILIGAKISYLVSKKGGWKGREVHAHIGIPESRQTEYKDFNKYQRRISKRDLVLCLGGGIVSTDELVEKCAKTEKEEEYLTTLQIYENKELKEIIKNIQSVGLDPVEILKKAYKDHVK